MALYNIKSQTTGKVVAFTNVTPFDSDWAGEEEILEIRIEAAVDDGYIPWDAYTFIKNPKQIITYQEKKGNYNCCCV